jgi:hypothetical protein
MDKLLILVKLWNCSERQIRSTSRKWTDLHLLGCGDQPPGVWFAGLKSRLGAPILIK